MASAKKGLTELDTTDDVPEGRLDVREVWVVVSAASGLKTAPLPQAGRILIGRSKSCGLVVDDGSVSREHAAIFDIGGELRVEDLGSRNKTKVMGRALAEGESAPITVGSVIEIGHATILLQRGQPAPKEALLQRAARGPLPGIVLHDPTMQRLEAMLEVIAPSALHVLLLGETGTGKEVFAEAVHQRSARARGPMLRVNCAGMSGSLLESELFGHERGAFTGALVAKPGLFEAAHGGTLFLDEIGEMPLDTQAKVLRVIERGEVVRLGSAVPRIVDVRYVAATHRDLTARIADGSFRSDLFFRLNGYMMTLPPLRQRTKDIVPLAELFLARGGGPATTLDPAVRLLLERHTWPGNVRELKSVIERARVLAGPSRPILPEHIQISGSVGADPSLGAADPGPALRSRRESFEYERILAVLEQTKGDRKEAAAILGLAYRTLLTKLAAHGGGRRRND